jgi:hypothetical protein
MAVGAYDAAMGRVLTIRPNVRFSPEATELLRGSETTRSARGGLMHRSEPDAIR